MILLILACLDSSNAPSGPDAERVPWSKLGPTTPGGAPAKPPWYDGFFGKPHMPDPNAEKFTDSADTGIDTDTDTE